MAVRALASVNVAAIERNVRLLRGRLTGGAGMCAVVKGNGYGHGAVPSARAALAGGAAMLAVATALEASELRAAGIEAPLLVLGALSREELPIALEADAELVAWTPEFVSAVRAAAGGEAALHVKFDSGMGRLGTRDGAQVLALAEAIDEAPELRLAGVMTHFATADGDLAFAREQLSAFAPVLAELRSRHPGLTAHAANSGATLRLPEAHLDLVRCGVAIYGLDPEGADPARHGLEPALELSSYVAAVKAIEPGQSAGYGRRFIAGRESVLGTLPIGYADGVRRGFSNNLEVLIGGRRRPLVGTVSMDNVTVELGPATEVRTGERAVLIGSDGQERQTAEELAARLGTINYEITCGLSARVQRHHHRDGEPL